MRLITVLLMVSASFLCAAELDFQNVPETLLPEGSATEEPAGTWTVMGAGLDVWGTSDEFFYMFETEVTEGDRAIGCHVQSLAWGTNGWAKAGLMFRTAQPEPPPLFSGPESYAFCFVSSNNGTCLQWRDGEGMNAAWNGAGSGLPYGPDDVWLKLIRRGDSISGYAALQPGLWIPLPPGEAGYEMLNLLGAEMYAGFAITSHEAGVLATAVIDGLDLNAPMLSLAGPVDLTAQAVDDRVQLQWTNQEIYDEIRLFRQDAEGQLELIEPGPDAADESFEDDPGEGQWMYWMTAVEEGLECVAVSSQPVLLGMSPYAQAIMGDNPIAYWKLGEADALTAVALGQVGMAGNGLYSGGAFGGEDSLVLGDDDGATFLDGLDGEVQIPDHALINTGGPYHSRSVELWFQADELVSGEQYMLFEEGGNTRGLNMYIASGTNPEGTQTNHLYVNAWNHDNNQGFWTSIDVSTDVIEEGEIYHVVMVFDASENEVTGDFDGRVTGYLNGETFGTALGADLLYAHADDGAIGGIHTNTRFHNGSTLADGNNFSGMIDEVALYGYPLDDPNDDGDMSDSRVMAHYVLGAGDEPDDPIFLRGDSNDDGKVNLADAICTLSFLFGPADDACKIGVGKCQDKADTNDDGKVNLADAITLLDVLFGTGHDIPPPSIDCGVDPTDDDDLVDCDYPEGICP